MLFLTPRSPFTALCSAALCSAARCSAALCTVAILALLQGCAKSNVAADGSLITDTAAPTVELEVTGASGKLDKAMANNVRAFVGLARESCDAPEWRIERRAGRAPDEAARALRALGYYAATGTASFERDGNCWKARIVIDPGEPVRITEVKVDISGDAADDPAFIQNAANLPLAKGDVLNHGNYESAKSAIDALAAERGYFDAEFTTTALQVDPDQLAAVPVIALSSGERYRFGTFAIEQDLISEDLASRLADFPEGEPYSADRLNDVNSALTSSGYFNSIFLSPDIDNRHDGVVDVRATVEARNRHRYTAGGGFTTDAGPRVRVGYENRRINHRGHRFKADARASLLEQDITAQYRIPLDDPAEEELSFEAGVRREKVDDIESLSGRVGARRTMRRFGDWRETLSLFYLLDDFEIGNDSGRTSLLIPGLTYFLTRADRPLRPTRGYKLSASLRGGSDALLSDVDFAHALVEASGVYAISDTNRVLSRASLGALLTDDFHALPPSQRFFAGGDTSVRGYDFRDLGPEDSDGDVIGGKYLGTLSLEFEHSFTPSWSGAVFADAGSAFDEDSDSDIGVGVGLGVRWQSPVGPVRVDLAHPLSESDDVVRLHLRLGPDL